MSEPLTVPRSDIRPGDTIVAAAYFNDVWSPVRTPEPLKIIEVGRDDGHSLHVKVEQKATAYTNDRYLTFREAKVERPATRKRTATRTIDGIKWISKGDKQWESEDGRWAVEYVDDFETECDVPHPVKITAADRAAFHAATSWDRLNNWPQHVRMAIEDGKRGYYCDGGEVHHYGQWVSGAVSGEPQVIIRDDTFEGAASAVARHIATGKIWA